MLIGWSRHQSTDDRSQPSAYFLDKEVMKTVGSQRILEARAPAPEILLGCPSAVQSAISALRYKAKYRVATLSFTRKDVDVGAFNAGHETARRQVSVAIDLFVEMAFAGVPHACRPLVLVGTHTHTGRLEINIAMPRYVVSHAGKLRSFNPHPPMKGSLNAFDAVGDFLNEQFNWENPRDPGNAASIKGPDWAEKRIAAAKRHGVKFDPQNDPKLFALQSAKIIAASRHGRDPSGFMSIFNDVVAGTEYELVRGQGACITLASKRDPHPFVLTGTSLGGRRRDQPVKTMRSSLSESWRRRAAWNASEYSGGVWDALEPDWPARIEVPQVKIPTCHPGWSAPTPTRRPQVFASLADRITAALRNLRKRLLQTTAKNLIGACLGALDTTPFRTIKNKLETIAYDTTDPQLRQADEIDRGVERSPSPRRGRRHGNSRRRSDRNAGHGNDRYQDRDGTAHESAGTGREDLGGSAAFGPPATDPLGGNENDLAEYQLDQNAIGSKSLRAVDIIRALRGASGVVFPGVRIDVGMTEDRGFRVVGSEWAVLISRSGKITAGGELPEDAYELLLNALTECLDLPSAARVGPEEELVGFAP